MKVLIIDNEEEYQAEKIVKIGASIMGYSGGQIIFEMRGIKDFSQYQLKGGRDFDIDEKALEFEYLLDLDFRMSSIELGL